jgi:hypothetical protein
VADTGPYFSLSGRSTTVYPPNASVASRTSAAPATARVPLPGDNASGPAITATPARATPLPASTRGPARSRRKTWPMTRTQTGSVASSRPAEDAGSHCSPTVTGRLYPTMPSRPATMNRGRSRASIRRKAGTAHGSRTPAASSWRRASSGSGASSETSERVATGASPHRHTAIRPALMPPGRTFVPVARSSTGPA